MRIIDGKKWYRPMEIAKLGLITRMNSRTRKPDSDYILVLKLIKEGHLKAKNYSMGDKLAYWMVSESAIEEYNKRFEEDF